MKYSLIGKLLLVCVTLCCVQGEVCAQKFQATLSHYSTDNGLASNAIPYIVQDDYGYIWIATWNGLSRFDGYHFYNYQTGATSHIPHLHNRIMDLAIDNQQNVWMRMYDGRVFVVKRSIDRIINPFEKINGSDDFVTKHPITVTSAGDVLVNVDGVGLYKMRIRRDDVDAQFITTSGLTISSMAEGYQNDVWLGTDKGVHRLDVSNLTVEHKGVFLDEKVRCLFSNGYNIYVGTESGKIFSFSYGQDPKCLRTGSGPITGLFVDSHGIVWFSDTREGALRIKPNSSEEKLFSQRIVVPDYDGAGASFNEINGTVWVRMNRGGYGYYNRDTDEVEHFHNDPSNPWNLSNTVNAVLELSEGVIWESTSRRGLEKLEILKKTIERIQLYPEEGPSLNNEIRAMVYDQNHQQLVFANKAGNLFVQRSDGTRRVFPKVINGVEIGRVYGLYIDYHGNYWASCKDAGLFKLTPKGDDFVVKNYRHDDNNNYSMSDNRAYSCVEDKQGNIWVATYGGGVNLLTKNKSGQEIFMHDKNVMRKYPYNAYQKVRTVAIDKEGNLWAGTTDGILVMSYKNNKISIEPLKLSEEDPDHILMSNDVVCLALDRQGDMWVGTNGGGLAHTIGKDSRGRWLFENFGSKDGLPSEEIRSITFDDHGNVWFATDHVLCSYDMGKRIFTTFSNLDGVDETMCSEGAAVSMPNGNILFGTVNGYYLVDRSKLVTTAGSILKLRITDFFLNDELQSPRTSSLFDFYVPDAHELNLPSHGELFAFRFASLNYQLQHRVHYQYMLEGYDHTWQNATRQRMASYSDLPTGNYVFKVKAFLLESPDKYDMREIAVVVPPYFLLSSNAIWLYMALVIVLGIWLMFWRQHQLLKAEQLRILREGPRRQNVQEVDNDFLLFLDHFLEIHYSDPMLTIDELLEAAEMSEEMFYQQLWKSTKVSPKEYVSNFRLKKAIDMLETTDKDMAAIIYDCGYSDSAAFNRHFKQKTGMSPSAYRDLHKKKPVSAVD